MKASSLAGRAAGVLWAIVMFTTHAGTSSAQVVTANVAAEQIRIVDTVGKVEFSPKGSVEWRPAAAGQELKKGDRVRTRLLSAVTIRWSERSVVRIGQTASFEILDSAPNQPASFSLITGILYFFHRDRLVNARYRTGNASAGLRGTEFVLQAVENGRTTLTVVEGEVDLSNEVDQITLRTGEQGIADPGQPPRKSPGILINDVIQWALHYPAVLDLNELPLSVDERMTLAESMHAYRIGDLLKALDAYPPNREQTSPSEKLYFAALLLAVGDLDRAQALLEAQGGADKLASLSDALRVMIATVKRQQRSAPSSPQLATEWLANSYHHQSTGGLRQAIEAAYKSVEVSPQFGFAWARVAELEFSYGHTREMSRALDNALKYSPANAHTMTLQGFVHAARNEMRLATQWFARAIEVDGAFANAWLGRGLSLIRQGQLRQGREDLLLAAALEPQRAILRSYLAKAYTDEGEETRAAHELKLAKDLDPNDPTAWLYSALLNEQENRVNDAIRDLEKSQELTGNRLTYRSGLLLDQDRAVRSANLARIYQDAGMFDVAVREAGRAVSYDYANYAAHLFLANAYDSLRDPNRINLRYETPAESEYLIANILAPVGAGILAQSVSQQEYSRLFERDRLGVASTTEYLSRGAWVEHGAQYGIFQNSSYLLEALYRSDPGERSNNDFEETELRLHLKQQLTERDSLYFRAIYYDAEGGDRFQYYDPSLPYTNGGPNLLLRTRERQEPTLTFGYHRQWSPASHTLLFGGRYEDTYKVNDPQSAFVLRGESQGSFAAVTLLPIGQFLHTDTEIYATEAQHIWQSPVQTSVIGGRYQWGDFHVRNVHFDFGDAAPLFPEPPVTQTLDLDFERWSVYVYQHWQIAEPLQLVGGISYDWMRFPENFRSAPMSERHEEVDEFLPKAGVIWTPTRNTIARAAYTRSLAGASLDQSLRLEPTQVAGFNQAFRSLIPETVVGANAGARFETYSVSIEQKLHTGTYIGLRGEILYSDVRRTIGAYTLDPLFDFVFPTRIREELDYRERAVVLTINQLLADDWAFGAHYRLSEAELSGRFPEVLAAGAEPLPPFEARQNVESVLHQLNLQTVYNHPSGFFAQFQSWWNLQSNHGYTPDRAGDEFWQFDLLAGYRFLDRRVAVTLGILNLTDQDYQLNPLTLHSGLPRERTWLARLQFHF